MKKEDRLHFEVGFPISMTCGENSCASDFLGTQKGRREARTGQESNAHRRTSLAVQWLRYRLPKQESGFNPCLGS